MAKKPIDKDLQHGAGSGYRQQDRSNKLSVRTWNGAVTVQNQDAGKSLKPLDKRPPTELTKEQKSIWKRVVDSAEWLAENQRELIVILCRGIDQCARHDKMKRDLDKSIMEEINKKQKDVEMLKELRAMSKNLSTDNARVIEAVRKIAKDLSLLPKDRAALIIDEIGNN